MCSLGVVAFELWHPFKTGMERVALLQALREGGNLPEAWEAAHPQACALQLKIPACPEHFLHEVFGSSEGHFRHMLKRRMTSECLILREHKVACRGERGMAASRWQSWSVGCFPPSPRRDPLPRSS